MHYYEDLSHRVLKKVRNYKFGKNGVVEIDELVLKRWY